MNDTALSEKTTPAPRAAVANAATARPPSAGPAARARLKPALLRAMASASSGRGTNSGTMDCQAGLFRAEPMLSRKVSASRVAGETIPASVRAARMATLASIHDCQKSSRRRRSKISAAPPAGKARKSAGRLAAVCIRAMSSGEVVSAVINHAPAVSCIHPPTFETMAAIHKLRKTGRRSAAQPETGVGVAAVT